MPPQSAPEAEPAARGSEPHFRDRRDAGRALARVVAARTWDEPVVIALPRGGVPVGFEVARRSARRWTSARAQARAPRATRSSASARSQRTAGGPRPGRRRARRNDGRAARADGRSRGARARGGASAIATAVRRRRRGRTVIVVDDGLATGLTDLAAVRALRARGARTDRRRGSRRCAPSRSRGCGRTDEIVCLTLPRRPPRGGRWYGDFPPSRRGGGRAAPRARARRRRSRATTASNRRSTRERLHDLDVDGVELARHAPLPAKPRAW